tara:strand:+ start:148 stop:786 length:639 start_codon:yes stop_codon:yes gene_type:complete
MSKKEIKVITPANIGWLKYKLDPQEMDYVWRCIETNKKRSVKDELVGNISASYDLMDRGDWFYTNTVTPLIKKYDEEFDNLGRKIPIATRHPYYMNKWWVNYQKQNEFNPFHNHTGIYSFVIWMKIPYDCEKQNKKDIARDSNSPSIGTFQFSYHNILGEGMGATYDLTPEDEGTMLFFPALLYHQVYPFYDCDEDRISVSGNILVDITKKL